MIEVILALAFGVAALLSVLAVRAARLRPDEIHLEPVGPFELEDEGSAERLSHAITYRTISHQDRSLFSEEQFVGFHEYLKKAFPRVHSDLERESVGNYSLLYTWKGAESSVRPILLMAHMDVVPVEEDTLKDWTHPPFEGRIQDGQVWGRGALDDKVGVMGILEALEGLVKAGMKPARTVYIGFGHDEEIGGEEGAMQIAELLRARGVRLEFVLDEGGFVADGTAFGVAGPIALVGIAEKGYLSVELTVEGEGGHSSMPPRRTAIGILSAAIDSLERNRPAGKIEGPVRRMLEKLAPQLSYLRRIEIANLWLFKGLVMRRLSRSPVADSLIRTTTAPTMVRGGVKENILPASARAIVNFRIRPGQSIESVLNHVERTVKDSKVKITPVGSALTFQPSEGSGLDSENYGIVYRTIRQTLPEVEVVPYLVVGATDSRHFNELAEDVLKFVPLRMTSDLMKTVHGIDERLPTDQYADVILFYAQLIRNAASDTSPPGEPE